MSTSGRGLVRTHARRSARAEAGRDANNASGQHQETHIPSLARQPATRHLKEVETPEALDAGQRGQSNP